MMTYQVTYANQGFTKELQTELGHQFKSLTYLCESKVL